MLDEEPLEDLFTLHITLLMRRIYEIIVDGNWWCHISLRNSSSTKRNVNELTDKRNRLPLIWFHELNWKQYILFSEITYSSATKLNIASWIPYTVFTNGGRPWASKRPNVEMRRFGRPSKNRLGKHLHLAYRGRYSRVIFSWKKSSRVKKWRVTFLAKMWQGFSERTTHKNSNG